MPYEPPEIETDLDVVTDRIFDEVAARLPGWEPAEGSLDTAIVEEVGRETVLTNNRAVEVIDLGVAAMGETVFGLAAGLATPATLEVIITVTEVGAVIPAGLIVVGVTDVGVETVFTLPIEVTAGTTTTTVTMHATTPGSIANGVPPGPLVVATATATVVSAVATTESTGGLDAELLVDYVARLADYLSILRVGAVRGTDLEILARSTVGIHRARAVDLYDAVSEETDVERTATVFVVDVAGEPVAPAVKTALETQIESVREVNFVAYVRDPTYTGLEVEFTAVADPGADPAVVEDAVIAAIGAYLDPAAWGSLPNDPRAWAAVDLVRYLDLVAVAGSVDGVASLTSLTLNGGTANVTLTGPGPLPASTTAVTDPTTITGSVT